MHRLLLRLGVTALVSAIWTVIFSLLWGSVRFVLAGAMPDKFFMHIILIYASASIIRNQKVAQKVIYDYVEKPMMLKTTYYQLILIMTSIILSVIVCFQSIYAYTDTALRIIDFIAMIYTSGYIAHTLAYCLLTELVPYEQAATEIQISGSNQNKKNIY